MATRQVAAPFRETVPGDISSYDVEGDLTAYEYCFVELDTNRARTVKAYSGGFPVGVLTNRPVEDPTRTEFSTVALVQYKGKALVRTGNGGLAPGDLVKVAAGGVAVKASPSDGDILVGQCEVGADAGEIATVRLFSTYVRVVS
ncbi:MAG: hypothetical protein N3G75_07670 [Methanothrix sp.]|nr:hypothetical protein [Methanothrix sp.]MCX8207692.1 hypothetical protein [Methanothrix sp.]